METSWNQRCIKAIRLEKVMGPERYYKEVRHSPIIEPDTTVYPWKRDKRGNPVERVSKARCSICKSPVYDNVDPEKVITCGSCVQRLLTASGESKIGLRNSFLERGDKEGARSVESFIREKDWQEWEREVKADGGVEDKSVDKRSEPGESSWGVQASFVPVP